MSLRERVDTLESDIWGFLLGREGGYTREEFENLSWFRELGLAGMWTSLENYPWVRRVGSVDQRWYYVHHTGEETLLFDATDKAWIKISPVEAEE